MAEPEPAIPAALVTGEFLKEAVALCGEHPRRNRISTDSAFCH